MNISGKWKGKYTFGKGYSPSHIGTSDPFELDLTDDDGIITGTCIDKIVNFTEGNGAEIMGSFHQNEISFKKSYKIQLALDENGELIQDKSIEADGVDYVGRWYKRFLWRKPCFKGTWSIKGIFKIEDGTIQPFECYGTWKMKKVA